MTSVALSARTYPMRYGGGVFLCCVGAAIVAGALLGGGLFGPLLIAGFVLGAGAIFAVRSRVAARFGRPARREILLMYAAIAFELASFAILSYCMSNKLLPDTDQFLWTAVLVIVAAHFLLMVWSFGAWMFYLGAAILLWLAAAWVLKLPFAATLVGDGVLKIGFGLIMAAPLFAQQNLEPGIN